MEEQDKNKFFIWLARIFDLGKFVIILAMAIYIIHLFVMSVFVVSGASMEPNFHEKEYLVVNKISPLLKNLKRGDVVVFKFPGELDEKYIKRVIGLPGETIEIKDNSIYVNGKKLIESYIPKEFNTASLSPQSKWTLEKEEYFVLGDNRDNSNDSRVWGQLPQEDLIGKISYTAFPFSERRRLESPSYYSDVK